MTDKVGPFRTEAKLNEALAEIDRIARGNRARSDVLGRTVRCVLVDWLDLRNMTLVARSVCLAALARQESRGAHQREDFPGMDPRFKFNQVIDLRDGKLALSSKSSRAAGTEIGERPGMNATLLIKRGAANEPHRVERFDVPFVAGQTVLDGLRYIRANPIRRSPSASPASMPMPARNA